MCKRTRIQNQLYCVIPGNDTVGDIKISRKNEAYSLLSWDNWRENNRRSCIKSIFPKTFEHCTREWKTSEEYRYYSQPKSVRDFVGHQTLLVYMVFYFSIICS